MIVEFHVLRTGMDIVKCNIPLKQRFGEFWEILSPTDYSVPASRVKFEWVAVAELEIEQGVWNAIWKVSRTDCEFLGIDFPSLFYIKVETVLYDKLSAVVELNAVINCQDCPDLPDKLEVPLIQLYPTKMQDRKDLDIFNTAKCIDQLRFFYNNIWRPWDDSDMITADWPKKHLNNRINIYINMASVSTPLSLTEKYNSMLQEAKDINRKMKLISEQDKNNSLALEVHLCQLSFRLQNIQSKIEMMENPELRKMVILQQVNLEEDRKRQTSMFFTVSYLVFLPCTLEELLKLTETIQSISPLVATYIRPSSSISDALLEADDKSNILLNLGDHKVHLEILLNKDISFFGLHSSINSRISSLKTASRLFGIEGGILKFENLALSGSLVQTILHIYGGCIQMENCMLIGSKQSIQSIFMLNGRVELENCVVTGFTHGLTIGSNAEVKLSNCSINKCKRGILIENKAKLFISNTLFEYCDIGLDVQFVDGYIEETFGSDSLLSGLNNFDFHNLQFNSTCKCYVHVFNKKEDKTVSTMFLEENK